MKSGLYEGWVSHQRHAVGFTGGVKHGFRYRTTMPLLYLSEMDEVMRLHPLASATRSRPWHFRRRDYTGAVEESLEETIKKLVETRLGFRPSGDVAMLAHVRTWGWLFNPIAVFYCWDASGDDLEAIVLEVRNTPWHERTIYVLAPGPQRFAKEMHVSPFLPMELDYEFTAPAPEEKLTVHLGNRRGDERVFDATLSLRRRELSRQSLRRLILGHPFNTIKVSTAIYWQALLLWLRRATFFSHPRRKVARGAS